MLPILLNFDPAHDVNDRTLPSDISLAKRIADILDRHYPGHAWVVEVIHTQGVVRVRNFMLSQKFGMVLHLRGVKAVSDWERDIVRAGGEFLERWQIHRGRFRIEDYAHIKPFAKPKSGAGL